MRDFTKTHLIIPIYHGQNPYPGTTNLEHTWRSSSLPQITQIRFDQAYIQFYHVVIPYQTNPALNPKGSGLTHMLNF